MHNDKEPQPIPCPYGFDRQCSMICLEGSLLTEEQASAIRNVGGVVIEPYFYETQTGRTGTTRQFTACEGSANTELYEKIIEVI